MKRFILFLLVVVFAFGLTVPLSADTGPKPSITVYVENAPEEEYYLDLLIEEEQPNNTLTEDEIASLDSSMLAVLREYNENGKGRLQQRKSPG